VLPRLRLQAYLNGGAGTDAFLLGGPLDVEVPRQWWRGATSPGRVYLAVEVSEMPVITGEEVEEFQGFPWNVCFYVACAGFQTEGFWKELRSNGGAPPWEPWFVWDAMHGGHSAPLFQLDADTEEVAVAAAKMLPPFIEDNFTKLMAVPINRIGSHGFDWLRGDLVMRREPLQGQEHYGGCRFE
jgi:hypothetical protein